MSTIRGLTYPLSVKNGQLSVSRDAKLVEEHVLSVLETRPFERVLRADYGLKDQIFNTINPQDINSLIILSIQENVPEVKDLEISGNWERRADEGIYNIKLSYKINSVPQPPLNLSLNF
jgi:hypothetical protein